VWSIEHSHYLRPSLLTDTILCCSQFSETPSTPETLETRRMSYLRPSLRIVRIIRHRSEAGEEQRPVCWASGTLWTEGKETCIKAPYLEGTIHLSETPSTMRLLRWTPLSFCSKEAPESQGPGRARPSEVSINTAQKFVVVTRTVKAKGAETAAEKHSHLLSTQRL
jgi:hypothetical protein